jgi:hypothetical protein
VDFFAVTAQVRLWHKADIPNALTNVRFWGVKRTLVSHSAMSASDSRRLIGRVAPPGRTDGISIVSIASADPERAFAGSGQALVDAQCVAARARSPAILWRQATIRGPGAE